MPDIKNELIRHFIRGYFDGDGTVYTYRNKYTNVAFSGNKNFLVSVKSHLMNNNIVKSECKVVKEQKDKNCYKYPFSSQADVKRFYDYIYKDATVFMERKYNKFGNSLHK